MTTWHDWNDYYGNDDYCGDDLTIDNDGKLNELAKEVHTYLYQMFKLIPKRDIKPLKVTDDWLDTLAYIERL